MEPVMKRSKKRAKKAVGKSQPEAPAAKTAPTDNYLSFWDEEELVDYEPEEPAAFSPVEDDLSVQECYTPAHGDGPANIPPHSDDLPAYLAEGSNVAGRKRSHFFKRGRREVPPMPTPKCRQQPI
jgi:hypothetical protein